MSGAQGGQKRELDPQEPEMQMVCEPPCVCQDPNPDSLQEQQVFLTSGLKPAFSPDLNPTLTTNKQKPTIWRVDLTTVRMAVFGNTNSKC